MTTPVPSVKEALERARLYIAAYRDDLLRDFCTLNDERVPDRSTMDFDEAEMVADVEAEIESIDAALATPSQPDDARERIAETIWRAELRRATGKERNVPWLEIAEIDRNRFLYVADAIIAAGLVADESAIRADEREKCAKEAENFDHRDSWSDDPDMDNVAYVAAGETCDEIAAAIRRGE